MLEEVVAGDLGKLPVEHLKDVPLCMDEVVIGKGRLRQLAELVHTWVGHL